MPVHSRCTEIGFSRSPRNLDENRAESVIRALSMRERAENVSRLRATLQQPLVVTPRRIWRSVST
jgi:hypothetical protein